MKKVITILSTVVLFLVSCGNETTAKKLEQKENYRYVEIEECNIPIPKKFEELKSSDMYLYRFWYGPNIQSFMKINISKNKEDDYIDSKNVIIQYKKTQLEADFVRNHFKILKWKMPDNVLDEVHYNLFGLKTKIILINSNKAELNYLLDYCKKTWKLNKGDK